MASAGTAWLPVKPDMKGFGSEMDGEVQKSGTRAGGRFMSGFKKHLKLGAAIGGALIVGGGLKLMKGAVQQASDLGESVNAVNVTFGKSAKGIHALGKTAATSLGLSRSEFNGLAVQFSSFAGQIAGKGGNVAGVMKDMTTRAADFASVMNLDVADAAAMFQSGLAGETEPLKKFGLDLSAAAVEAHAYSKGIANVGEELTEGEKVQARYSLLMEKTSKTSGDFANTSDSLANSQRILKARMANLQAEAGKRLVPALESISGWALKSGLPALSSLGGALVKVGGFVKDNSTAFKILGGVLLGVTVLTAAHGAVLAVTAAGGMVAYLKATKLITVATKAWAAGQWVLNAALAANPVGLVIVAVAGLAAGLVIAWKKSDTFRKIVTGAFDKVKGAAIGAWNWLKRQWPLVLGILTGPFGLAVVAIAKNWDTIKGKGEQVVGWIRALPAKLRALGASFRDAGASLIGKFFGGLSSIAGKAGNIAAGIWDGVRGFLNSAIGKINAAIPNQIGKGPLVVDLPNNPFPTFARGGTMRRAGIALVGEEGPELVHLPGGAHVQTAMQTRAMMNRPMLRGAQVGGDSGGPAGLNVENLNVKAYSDRFSTKQVMDDLALHGVL